MHIPSFWVQPAYQSLNEKGRRNPKITVPKSGIASRCHRSFSEITKNSTLTALFGTLSSQGQLQLNDDFPVDLTLKSDLQAFKSKDKTILPASKVDLNLSGSLKTTALSLTTGCI